MDRLIVLNQGKIVEEGDHAELLRRGALYAELWSRQSGGFLPTGKPRRAPGEALSANESA
jgi:ATP-binding cassette subfamily B multidrug efflux pump